MDLGAYHVLELQIASDPADARRVMPAIRKDFERILDVGCGAGQTLIASALGAHVTAIGIDRDFEALKLGRKLDKRIPFVCSRGETLPIRSDYFDLVISRVALPYMKTGVALAEMTRVLRPGGTLWFALHPVEFLAHALAQSLRSFRVLRSLRLAYALANGLCAHLTGLEFAAPFTRCRESFQTEKRIVRRLGALGYENIRVQKKGFFVVTATKPVKRGDADIR